MPKTLYIPKLNVEIRDLKGRLLRSVSNTVTDTFREQVTDFLLGTAVIVPEYIAVGNSVPLATESAQAFTILKREVFRKQQSSRVEQSPDIARIAVVFNQNEAQFTITELGLLSAAESAQRIAECDALSGGNEGTWTTDGVNALTLQTAAANHRHGTGAVQTIGTASLSFENSTLVPGASVSLSEANDQINLWYYINPANLPAAGFLQIRIGSDATNYYQWRLASSAFLTGANWNFLELAFASSGGNAITDGATARNAIELAPSIDALDYVQVRTVDAAGASAAKPSSSTERLDMIRGWRPRQGTLWAYAELNPSVAVAGNGYVVYWYIATRESADLPISEPFSFEQLSIGSGSASSLTAGTYNPSAAAPAREAFITVRSADIRYRLDGTVPTASVGHFHSGTQNVPLVLTGFTEISNFRAIATSGTATIDITYYR